MKNAFVQFANLLHAFYAQQPAESREVDAMLAWIYEQNQLRIPVRVTDLVTTQRFGTLPTVNKRLKDIKTRGLVQITTGSDRRTRLVTVTAEGESILHNREALLREAAASEARRRASAAA